MIKAQTKTTPFSVELKNLCCAPDRTFLQTATSIGINDSNLHFYLRESNILPARHFARLLDLCNFSQRKKDQLWEKYDLYAQQNNPKSFKAIDGCHNFPYILKTTESPLMFVRAGLALCGQSLRLFNSVFDPGSRSQPVLPRKKYIELLEQIDWLPSERASYLKSGKDLYDRNFEKLSDELAKKDNYKGILKICRLRSDITVKEIASELNISASLIYQNENSKDDSVVPFDRIRQLIEIYSPPTEAVQQLLSAYLGTLKKLSEKIFIDAKLLTDVENLIVNMDTANRSIAA